ncbi:hypothetical protein MiSe_64950 [Microseira wollei NIES-4236]|uniref:Transposase n=1 Tax=Microseira wollei NIES-4236 TaxID=2530354 RepID=A0AAV3XPX4_9CYAN|nr:hypothetical protein MiSe_64950 [Microseira wollei NIES-4236]
MQQIGLKQFMAWVIELIPKIENHNLRTTLLETGFLRRRFFRETRFLCLSPENFDRRCQEQMHVTQCSTVAVAIWLVGSPFQWAVF